MSLRRRFGASTWAIPFAIAIIAIVAFLIVRMREQHPHLPYKDSFALGKAQEWRAFGGTWEIQEGGIQNNSDERGAKLITGDPSWRNYSVDADLLLLGSGGDAGLILRASDEEKGVDAYSGYYAGLRSLDQTLTIGRADHGWMEYKSAPVHDGVQMHHWYHLQVTALGCDILAIVTDSATGHSTAVSMHEEHCVRAGRFGLRSYSAGGMWRNVQVKAATTLNAAQLQEAPPPATSPDQLQTESGFNSRQDALSHRLQNIEPSHSANAPADHATVNIDRLRFASRISPSTETIRGSVVLTSPVLDVQDSTGGVVVVPKAPLSVKVGDEIEATGDTRPGPFSAVLESAAVHVRSSNAPIPPLAITAVQAATGSFDARYVELEGRLLRLTRMPNMFVLDLSQGSQTFTGIVVGERMDLFSRRLKPGSILRLRGVLSLDSAYTHKLVPFAVLLQSPDDVEILAGPPWWDRRRLLTLAFASILAAFAGFFILSRLEQWRLHAVMEERGRMAHDLHDTLSQSFAGIGFQLQAIQYELDAAPESLKGKVDSAYQLVRRSHFEARQAITTLRVGASAPSGLLTELEQAARRMVHSGQIPLVFTETGHATTVPLKTLDAMFRIGQEAIANAVRHANPTRLAVTLHFGPREMTLTIVDNGIGFDMQQQPSGYGLTGMRERAGSIAATLTITSTPNSGTRVKVVAPTRLPGNRRPGTFLRSRSTRTTL